MKVIHWWTICSLGSVFARPSKISRRFALCTIRSRLRDQSLKICKSSCCHPGPWRVDGQDLRFSDSGSCWPNSWWCTFLTIKWGGDWGRLTVYILSSTFTSLLQDAYCLLWANNFWTVVFSLKMKTKLLWSFLKEWTWGKTASSSDRKLPTFASIWMSLEIYIWIRHLRFTICLYLDVIWDLQLYLYLHSKGSIYIHCVIVGWHILIIYHISRNKKHAKFQNYTNWK